MHICITIIINKINVVWVTEILSFIVIVLLYLCASSPCLLFYVTYMYPINFTLVHSLFLRTWICMWLKAQIWASEEGWKKIINVDLKMFMMALYIRVNAAQTDSFHNLIISLWSSILMVYQFSALHSLEFGLFFSFLTSFLHH